MNDNNTEDRYLMTSFDRKLDHDFSVGREGALPPARDELIDIVEFCDGEGLMNLLEQNLSIKNTQPMQHRLTDLLCDNLVDPQEMQQVLNSKDPENLKTYLHRLENDERPTLREGRKRHGDNYLENIDLLSLGMRKDDVEHLQRNVAEGLIDPEIVRKLISEHDGERLTRLVSRADTMRAREEALTLGQGRRR